MLAIVVLVRTQRYGAAQPEVAASPEASLLDGAAERLVGAFAFPQSPMRIQTRWMTPIQVLALNSRSALTMTSNETPISAAIAAHKLAKPPKVRITKTTLIPSDNATF